MIESKVSLKQFNTFGIDVSSKFFAQAQNEDEVRSVIQSNEFLNNENLILGGGSNILFTKNFDGIVLRNNIGGVEVLEETSESVLVKVGGGVVWHELALFK